MADNKNLNQANKAKKDEFYTQLVDIEAELKHYKKHFENKVVLCNCDDPYESNFFKYFAMNFNHLKLKKLICTCYMGSAVAGEQFGQMSLFDHYDSEKTIIRPPYKIEISEVIDSNEDGAIDLSDVRYLLLNGNNTLSLLDGDGDFRSEECIALLKQADIVVTNPPFSLFREYLAQLITYGKQFLIIGNINAVTYKEVFPLIKENRMWLGYSIHSGDREFRIPDDYPLEAAKYRIGEDGKKYIRVKGVRWYTNMDYVERHTDIDLWKKYSSDEYPTYENYDAINVDVTAEIPNDYFGVMGVPITFFDKYNPDQFDILGMCENMDLYGLKTKIYTTKECRDRYFELFGKKGTYDLNAAGVVNGKKTYQRILIRRRQNGNQTP